MLSETAEDKAKGWKRPECRRDTYPPCGSRYTVTPLQTLGFLEVLVVTPPLHAVTFRGASRGRQRAPMAKSGWPMDCLGRSPM